MSTSRMTSLPARSSVSFASSSGTRRIAGHKCGACSFARWRARQTSGNIDRAEGRYCILGHATHLAIMPEIDREKVRREFADAVNMSPAELQKWLATPESRSVGWKGGDGKARESVGHASGRRIVAILRK